MSFSGYGNGADRKVIENVKNNLSKYAISAETNDAYSRKQPKNTSPKMGKDEFSNVNRKVVDIFF